MAERFARWIGTKTSIVLHTVLFVGCFAVGVFGLAPWDRVMLVLTTAVSLEAIYLAIFIQMTVNAQTQSLEAVEEDIGEIQEDVDEIAEDVNEIQEDVDEIAEDVDEIQEDIEEIEEEVDEIQEVDAHLVKQEMLNDMIENLNRLLKDVERMKGEHAPPAETKLPAK